MCLIACLLVDPSADVNYPGNSKHLVDDSMNTFSGMIRNITDETPLNVIDGARVQPLSF